MDKFIGLVLVGEVGSQESPIDLLIGSFSFNSGKSSFNQLD
jgi:hypothetical protein